MIRPFKMTDLGYFLPNEWSDPDRLLAQIEDPEYITLTLWDEVLCMTAAILCFRCYWGKNWHGAFLISKDFLPPQAVMLKSYIAETMNRLDAGRLQTESVADETLDRWHEFLGFEYEGTRRKMLYGRDYKMWAIVREGQDGR